MTAAEKNPAKETNAVIPRPASLLPVRNVTIRTKSAAINANLPRLTPCVEKAMVNVTRKKNVLEILARVLRMNTRPMAMIAEMASSALVVNVRVETTNVALPWETTLLAMTPQLVI